MSYTNPLLKYLADHYGPHCAAAVQKEFGGDSWYIGKKQPAEDPVQAFIEDNYGILTTRQIAKAQGLTTRAIQRRLNKPHSGRQRPIENIQTTLFT
jgi:DNA invertase Pin-like site-specific DNA recombinase